MSPRTPDVLPRETAKALLAAQAKVEAAHRELRHAIRDALEVGSVRQVAALLRMSPTTIQNWSKQN